MAWTLGTSGAAIYRAGIGASSIIVGSGAALAAYSDEAEAVICDTARYDVITNYSSLTANGKKVMQMVHNAYVAQKIVQYSARGYANLREFETVMDLCENDVRRGLALIEGDKVKTFLAVN